MRKWISVAVLMGALLMGRAALADSIFPSTDCGLGGDCVVASTSTAFSNTISGVTLAGTLYSWVLDTTPGAGIGNLLFVWQLALSSTTSTILSDFNVGKFSAVWSPTVDPNASVGHSSAGPVALGALAPSAITGGHPKANDGHPFSSEWVGITQKVAWDFWDTASGGGSTVGFGTSDVSSILWAQTTAPSWTRGLATVQDTSVGSSGIATFAPVPEPASLLLLGTGLLAIGGIARRNIQKRANKQL